MAKFQLYWSFYKSNLLEKAPKNNNIILANMTADLLLSLSEQILEYVASSSLLICSGIIENKEEEVIMAFENKGFNLLKMKKNNAWIALLLKYR